MGGEWKSCETPAERLRWIRRHRGHDTARAAAEAMGTPESTYTAHENGTTPFPRKAERYAAFYRISIDWLLTGRGAPFGRSEIEELYDGLPPEAQRQALEYLEFLKARHASAGDP